MEREIFYANRDGTNGMPEKNIHLSSDYELIAEFFGDRANQLREARLLLAAPDLLEACKEALELLIVSCGVEHNCATKSEQETLEKVNAAIAKAEGG